MYPLGFHFVVWKGEKRPDARWGTGTRCLLFWVSQCKQHHEHPNPAAITRDFRRRQCVTWCCSRCLHTRYRRLSLIAKRIVVCVSVFQSKLSDTLEPEQIERLFEVHLTLKLHVQSFVPIWCVVTKHQEISAGRDPFTQWPVS